MFLPQKCLSPTNCGAVVKKTLSTRTHVCKCGFVMDRDWNAAINILKLALGTTGQVGTWIYDPNATLRERQGRTGDSTSTHAL
ncbi:zinc ribbon domain-containing protein [Anabaena azotica]|uniref:zinc ribbon domain-containing protein n=1 Tax=Anabaena azotica TaxID=197653 RepID=UPI0036F1C04B